MTSIENENDWGWGFDLALAIITGLVVGLILGSWLRGIRGIDGKTEAGFDEASELIHCKFEPQDNGKIKIYCKGE